MRPNSIIAFERLYLGSLALSLINIFLSYEATIVQFQSDPAIALLGWGRGAVIAIFAISIFVSLLLWFFAARRRSSIAKWLLAAFTVIGLTSLPNAIASPVSLPQILTISIALLQLAATINLFRADAKPWFNQPRVDRDDPAVFE